jgi:2-polyprenyl-6-methoxyphenol hydroxylase-like FAD-dependent oxidoreductase
MSPVGGVGINLAIQDAVAAARILAEPLRHAQATDKPVSGQDLAKVRRRRLFPTAVVQGFQRLVHRFLFSKIDLPSAEVVPLGSAPPPRLIKIMQRLTFLQVIPPLFVAIGPLPEHAPKWARRPQSRSSSG